LVKKLQKIEGTSSNLVRVTERTNLEKEIEKIEKELQLLFKSELKKIMKEFIKANQKFLKEESEETEKELEKLENKLKEELKKEKFSGEDIKAIIRSCEKVIQQEEFQTQTEVPLSNI